MFNNYAFKEFVSLEIWEIVAIRTDKNTFLMDTYKTDIGQHFHNTEEIRFLSNSIDMMKNVPRDPMLQRIYKPHYDYQNFPHWPMGFTL